MPKVKQIAIAFVFVIFSIIMTWSLFDQNDLVQLDQETFLVEEFLGDGSHAILPIPQNLKLDSEKVALGEQLFADPVLSGNGFSCATCHPVERAGMDGLKYSITTGGGSDIVNTPSVFNSGFNAIQMWNGKDESLQIQLDTVINNPLHMNSSWQLIISRLKKDPDYQQSFSSIYPEGITKNNIINTIVTYERSMTTPNSDFDLYLRGNNQAISENQKKGFKLFKDYGCITCHQGINVGGNLFAKFGVFEHQYLNNSVITEYDYGRYSYTKEKQDEFVFRVPSLRNVAVTAPYFHNGSVDTLHKTIKIMAQFQLDIQLPETDINFIESFLRSLTGEYKGKKL